MIATGFSTRITGRRPRRFRPVLSRLEGRELMSGPGDTTAPVTFAAISGTPGFNYFYRSPVTVSLAPFDVDDAQSTLKTYYSINGGPITPGRTVRLVADGAYRVAYVSVDPAGNIGPVGLEVVRIDKTPPVVTAMASPSTLWPPNNKLVAVTVAGHVADNFAGAAPLVAYQVIDQDGQYQPGGVARVDAFGNYSFVVYLPASRAGQDKSGRTFVIDVSAVDEAWNVGTTYTSVFVPHDMGHGNGNDKGPGKGHGKGKG
jgi:hypothetical protein